MELIFKYVMYKFFQFNNLTFEKLSLNFFIGIFVKTSSTSSKEETNRAKREGVVHIHFKLNKKLGIAPSFLL